MANQPIFLDEDWHVHSTFSDGTASIAENVHAAEARELRTLCLVDHVRTSTDWVREFVDTCRATSHETTVRVRCGVEAKLLDTEGKLDVPAAATLADYVFIAAPDLPTPHGPMSPGEAHAKIEAGELLPAKAVEWLVRAAANAVMRHDHVVLAQPFSLLPKLGLDEGALHRPFVRWLATVMAEHGAATEISERWRCPEPWVAECFLAAEVPILASTDSHSLETLGRYEWCREVTDEVASVGAPALFLANTA